MSLNALVLTFIGYLLTGVFAVLFPTIMPSIITGFGLSLTAAGAVYPARAVGSLIGAFFGGMAADAWGYKQLLASSALLLTVGLGVSAFSGNWAWFVVGFFLAGVAQGALSTGFNAVTVGAGGLKRTLTLNQLHGTYSVGAAISPMLMGWLLATSLGWRTLLGYLVVLWLGYAIATLVAQYPAQVGHTERNKSTLPTLFRHPVFLLAAVVAFCYNGVAWSLIGWINTYLEQETALPAFMSTSMITLFYAALAGGRFACGALAVKYNNNGVLLLCAVGAGITYPLVLFGQVPVLMVIGVMGSGLFLSGLYPTALACASRYAPGQGGMVSGALANAMSLGTMIPPWWTGIIAQQANLQLALGLNYILILALLIAAFWLYRLGAAEPPVVQVGTL